jgi:integrase
VTTPNTTREIITRPVADAASSSLTGRVASRSHRFYEQPITTALREQLFGRALALLAARLPESQRRLDPNTHYTPVLEDWLCWLEEFPGETYQAKWLASGADALGRGWLDACTDRHSQRTRFSRAFEAIVCCGAIRPSYPFLLAFWSQRLWATWREEHDQAIFARLRQAAVEVGRTGFRVNSVLIDFCRIAIHTGKTLPELTCRDLLYYHDAALAAKGGRQAPISCATTYHCGRRAGLFSDGPDEFESFLTSPPLTPTEIVDKHNIASVSMRTLLTEYLTERRPDLDYVSFYQLAHRLCRLFWQDLEEHHPGIETHRLTREQVEAWKQRLMTLPDGRPRRRMGEVLLAVRCFYLDINHWANDQPERWAQWATPSPVTRQDVRVTPRERRAETARVHARIRDLAPMLPMLVRSARKHFDFTTQRLQVARSVEPGGQIDVAGHTYTRVSTLRPSTAVRLETAEGAIIDAVFAEHEAFWCWAMIEVLRTTGIRIEELLELTHYSIRPYRDPGGTVIPLLQVAPSKTDTERVIPASPELASVLAQVITRVAATDGALPLVSRHDEHERRWSDPLPHLFQYRLAGRPRAFNSGTLREYLDRAVERAELPGRVTPHDFRRLFSTDAVNNGLPIHIAAALLGHDDLNTTVGYTAIYPQEVFQRYQQFLERRRAERPTDEYRTPSAAELAEFAEHFGQRRIELGNCVRPYGTPCVHEHACLRCPFQQIEPDQLPRLEEIRDDVTRRLETARGQQWLGDVTELETTLGHIDTKRERLLALLAAPTPPLTSPHPATEQAE